MFETAELARKVPKDAYKRRVPKLRAALIDAQVKSSPHELSLRFFTLSKSVRRSVIASDAEQHSIGIKTERDIDHETRHHRRHWAHRIKARDQAEGTRP